VAAARIVIASKGVDATTIQEITDEADVGFGTFYNHFESKEAVLDDVVAALIDDFGASVDALTADIEDPAVAVATVVKNFDRLVDVDPVLSGLAVRVGLRRPEVGNAVAGWLREHLERGIECGRFDIPDTRAALVALGGTIYLSMQLRLAGRLDEEVEQHLVELTVRMLGVEIEEARRIAGSPLSELTGPVGV
jgi:AcrR family transcriptional regulator